MILTTTEREKVHEAATIFVDEFLKQVVGRAAFYTQKHRGLTAETYGDYETYICMVDDEEE